MTYGPLLNGVSCVVYEGVPVYPDPGRCWEIIAKYKVLLACAGVRLQAELLQQHVAYACPSSVR